MTAAAVAAPLALKAVNVEAPPRAVRIGGAAESIVEDESNPPSGPIIDIDEARDARGNIGPAPDSALDGSQDTETVGDVARSPRQGRQARPKPTTPVGGDLTEDSSASAASSESPVEEPTTLGSIGESTLTVPPEPDPSTTLSTPATTWPTTTTTVPTTPTSTSTTDGPEATVSTTTTTSGQTGSSGSTRASLPTGND